MLSIKWRINLQGNNVKTNVFPHTQAKLDLYSGYLEHYLRVLCNADFCKKINLFDIYCGAGIYDDGKKGSPLLALDCIRKIRVEMNSSTKTTISISLCINDYDVKKVENIRDKADVKDIENFTIEYHNKDANEMLSLVSDSISKYPKDNRNLIFIDPYGYSEIKKEKLISLLKNSCTEIVLFLPVMQMYRFTKTAFVHDEEPHYENLRNFIISFFNDSNKINVNSIFEYIHSLKEAFSINNTYYTCSHYLERGNGSYYALFFIGSNIYGLEKMLETKWNLDPGKGKGFKQIEDPNQLTMFDDEIIEIDYLHEISTFEDIIYQAIVQYGLLTNIDMYELALKNEFLPKHANTALKSLITKNKIRENNQPKGFGINYTNYRNKQVISRFEVL